MSEASPPLTGRSATPESSACAGVGVPQQVPAASEAWVSLGGAVPVPGEPPGPEPGECPAWGSGCAAALHAQALSPKLLRGPRPPCSPQGEQFLRRLAKALQARQLALWPTHWQFYFKGCFSLLEGLLGSSSSPAVLFSWGLSLAAFWLPLVKCCEPFHRSPSPTLCTPCLPPIGLTEAPCSWGVGDS